MAGASNSKIEFLVWLSQVIGGLCSRSAEDDRVFVNADSAAQNKPGSNHDAIIFTAAPQRMERNLPEPSRTNGKASTTAAEEFYDGIPRFPEDSLPNKPKSKVSEVSFRLGKAGTTGIAIGLEKAVEVLDTLGSSMTNLNASSGFVSGAAIKGNEISILAFEVANTIVKGFNLLQSLSAKSIRHLKEEVLLSHAVQDLVSKDMDELLRIVAADKRQELNVFSDEVIRFGNRSKNPQWHNLDRYFEKVSKELNGQRLSRDEAESIMQQLMTLVQFTAELYHELHALDRFEQDIQRKGEEEEDQRASLHQIGDGLAFLRAEIKSQKKQIRQLKKKSLWSRSLEEVMEKLVDIVHFLHLEISNAFGNADDHKPFIGHMSNRQRLGPAGLALHYANIVLQIDTLVARSSIPANTKDALYQSLPPNIKLALRSKLPSLRVVEELTIADITDEMEKTLHWLSPMATNTSKAHHGFGWVGEWANTGSEVRKTGVMQIETFHHADKDKVEYYILELLLWLHRLAIRSKAVSDAGKVRPAIKSPVGTALQNTNEQISLLTIDEQNMLLDLNKKIPIRRISKSLDFDSLNIRFRENCRLAKSRSHSSSRSKEISFNRIFSKLPVIDFDIDKERALNVIDRLDVMAGDSNSKRRVSRSTESKNTQDININIIEGNNNPKAQVQERAAVFDQHFYDGIPFFADNKPSRTNEKASTTAGEEFYDGIPRFPEDSLPNKPKSKVSEVSLRLGKAVTTGIAIGLEKAVEVLDTLGSSLTNLNVSSGFSSGAAIKGNKISILAFEVANTIVKGFNLLQSLSAKSIRHLKEEVLLSVAVQNLVSKDMDELLRIVAADKRQELEVFSNEELYHELDALDKLEQDFQRKCEEEDQRGDSLALLRAEIKSHMRQIRHLKKKSLWCRSLEEISNALGNADDHGPLTGHMSNCQRLGPAGLALHHANIVLQIDTLVDKSTMPANTKDALYQSLPPNIKLALRSKLPSLRAVEEISVAYITYEMHKKLHWLVPMAINTSKAHKRFGWLGEWAYSGYEVKKKTGVMWIETFYHADREKVEHCILELLLWLHRLAIRSKAHSDAIAG
ncbi:hypothetical protein GmHk_06G016133 [Glycine max]|nr:hypothetical protein GmHk_06G016133 [Glycine max]